MATDTIGQGTLLIEGGRIYDHDNDVDQPPVADILIVDGTIAAVGPRLAEAIATKQPVAGLGTRTVTETIDAAEKLVIPGFVNAHYHSHDVLLKGCFETIPLELWVLSALPPSYPKRSTAEIRARTLLGAIECLRSGITTVQDLATIYPFDEEHLDAILKAYDDVGIRCVFALQIADVPGVKSIPFWDEVVPADQRAALSGAVEPFKDIDLATLVRDLVKSRRGAHPRITWALGPSSPERCSEGLLSSLAELSASEKLPVYTHIYRIQGHDADRATDAWEGWRLVDQLPRAGRPVVTAAEPRPQRVDVTTGDRDARRSRHQCRSQSGRKPQDPQRRPAHPVVHAAKGECRSRLRQLQLQRRAEHVPVDEDVRRPRRSL